MPRCGSVSYLDSRTELVIDPLCQLKWRQTRPNGGSALQMKCSQSSWQLVGINCALTGGDFCLAAAECVLIQKKKWSACRSSLRLFLKILISIEALIIFFFFFAAGRWRHGPKCARRGRAPTFEHFGRNICVAHSGSGCWQSSKDIGRGTQRRISTSSSNVHLLPLDALRGPQGRKSSLGTSRRR